MPLINMKIMTGRTVDQKREMVRKVTDAVVETLICPPDAVRISIEEMDSEHYAVAGKLVLDQ